MQTVKAKRFDLNMFSAALKYYGLPAEYNRFFKSFDTDEKDKDGNPKTNLTTCEPEATSKAGEACWVQINPSRPDAPKTKSGRHKKPKNEDIDQLLNIQIDFELPADPDRAHTIGLALGQFIEALGLAERGLPVENSGAGCHIVLPLPALDVEELGSGNLVNSAVAAIVTGYIKPELDRLARAEGLANNLAFKVEAFDISRVLSAPGTWRPSNPQKGRLRLFKRRLFAKMVRTLY